MKLSEKYTSKTDSISGKKILSDDAYAICEFLEQLFNKMEQMRTK